MPRYLQHVTLAQLRARLIIKKSVHRVHFRKSSAPVQRFGVYPVYAFTPNQRQVLSGEAPIQHGVKMASLEICHVILSNMPK